MIQTAVLAAVAILAGYLLGSIPFGLILTRLFGLGDIRAIGSGNIGATNVLRTGNKGVAALTLLFDALKGTAAVFVGWWIAPELGLAAGAAAFVGHLFPVWLRFQGGKGAATYIGVLAAVFWPAAIVFAVAWLATAAATRISSASALLASLNTPVFLFFFADRPATVVFAVLTAILWWRHAANIRRLNAGTESRIGNRR
ncbi:MAG: glycerol-3-phosphate 1-O-acyltransferase PlsY [Dongiaceae bacterium]